MINYKKMAVILVGIILAGIWLFLTIDINRRYPNPEEKQLKAAEKGYYKGMELEVGEIELYTKEEYENRYGVAASMTEPGTYITVNLTLKNNTDQAVLLDKEGPVMWLLEVGNLYHNSCIYQDFISLNGENRGIMEAHSSWELTLPYFVYSESVLYDRLKKEEIRIVYSYYPTKNYIWKEGLS